MEDNSHLLESILQRLNILIALQLDSVTGSGDMAPRIRKLRDLGLSPSEVGAIVGKKANYVSAVLGAKGKQSRG